MTNSRTKGHTLERRICADLRRWLGDEWTVQRNLDDDQTGSRGRAGDVLVSGPHPWPFAIECKAGYGLRSSHLWKGTGPLGEQWAQACRQATAVGLLPMLITKPAEHGSPLLAVLPYWVRHHLGLSQPTMRLRLLGQRVIAVRWDLLMARPPVVVAELVAARAVHHQALDEAAEDLGSEAMMQAEDAWVRAD